MEYQDLCNIAYCYIPPFISKAGYINEEVNRAIEAIQIAYEKEIEALLPKLKTSLPEDNVNPYWIHYNGVDYWLSESELLKLLPKGE